jgi:predicted AAA+ superfamily ATPase
LIRRLHDPLFDAERGVLLETYILHELRAWMNVSACGGRLSYWRTPSGAEVDFVWTRGTRAVGIEVKASKRWRRGDGAALKQMAAQGVVRRGLGVYLGDVPLKDGPVDVLPVRSFLQRLNAGIIL